MEGWTASTCSATKAWWRAAFRARQDRGSLGGPGLVLVVLPFGHVSKYLLSTEVKRTDEEEENQERRGISIFVGDVLSHVSDITIILSP